MGPKRLNPGARALCQFSGRSCRTPNMCEQHGCEIELKLNIAADTPDPGPPVSDARGVILTLAAVSVAIVFCLLIVGGFI